MKHDPLRRPSSVSLPILLALLVACAAPTETTPEPGPAPPGPGGATELEPEPLPPWTETFRAPALLIADVIHVEGPKGLLNHFATRVEPDHHSYEAETLPQGFQQVFQLRRPESGVEIRAYLDACELVALRKLVLLERPGEVDVLIVAKGDVYWRDKATGAERRGPELTFRGE